MKFRKLSISLLWKACLIYFITLVVIGAISIHKVKSYNREYLIAANEESVNELLWVVANINSVMMQQMRSYTMLNDICHDSKDPVEIHRELQRLSKKRYKDFISISYVDYDTGLEYCDDGTIHDVSKYDYFISMKIQRRANKGLQTYGEVNDDWYSVCKDSEQRNNGYSLGFFVGKVKVSYLQRYLDKLKGKSFDAINGFPVLINSKHIHVCAPDQSVVLSEDKKFENNDELVIDQSILDFIDHPVDLNADGTKRTVTGIVNYKGTKYVMSVGMFSKTKFTLGVVTPLKTIDECSNLLMRIIIIVSMVTISIFMIILYFLFKVSFHPLTKLNESVKNIARGDADLTKRLAITSNNEIGQIQYSFNEYIAQLQNMISNIGESKKELVSVETRLATILSRTENELKTIDENLDKLKKNNIEKSSIISLTVESDSELSNDVKETSKKEEKLFSSLDASSASIDLITNELEEMIKKSYRAVNKISENVDGFIY